MSAVVDAVATRRRRSGPSPRRPGAGGRGQGQAWTRRLPLLPALVFLIVLTQLPFIVTLVVSFMNWNAYYPDERGFAGFDNFVRVFTDVSMRNAVVTTIVLTVDRRAGQPRCSASGIALLLDRQFLGRGIVRTMMIAPFLVVPVAAALLWKHALYNP